MTTYLTIYLVCWFFTAFEPIQDGIDLVFEIIATNAILKSLWHLLGCQYCLTFWLSFGITRNVVVALALSAIAQIHSKIIKWCSPKKSYPTSKSTERTRHQIKRIVTGCLSIWTGYYRRISKSRGNAFARKQIENFSGLGFLISGTRTNRNKKRRARFTHLHSPIVPTPGHHKYKHLFVCPTKHLKTRSTTTL